MSEQPFEKMYGGLAGIVRGCKTVKSGLNKATKHVLDPDGKVWARCDKLQAEAESGISSIRNDLAKERKEIVAAERKKNQWASPSCMEGWLCTNSPTGVCVYEDPDEINRDYCDYCGFPKERQYG